VNKYIITVEQAPIIKYDFVEEAGREVEKKILSLDIENIEASEDNFKLLKSTRAELSKDYQIFEEQRKLAKDKTLKPYSDFEEVYKKNISNKYKDADILLKTKVDAVDKGLLDKKISEVKEYFNQLKVYSFVTFEDLELKITRSRSDNLIKGDIHVYLTGIKDALLTIETLDNKDRVLAKFHLCKNLAQSISQVNVEMKKEEEILKAKQREKKIGLDYEHLKKYEPEKEILKDKQRELEDEPFNTTPSTSKTHMKDSKIFEVNFKVTATIKELKELKNYMDEKGLKHESIS